MRQEFKDKLNNRIVGIWINADASGLSPDEKEATEFDMEKYLIHDDIVWSLKNDKILSLDDIDDSEWDYYIKEGSSYFECFIENLLCEIIENEDLYSHYEIRYFLDTDMKLFVLLQDENDNIEEELSEVYLPDFV